MSPALGQPIIIETHSGAGGGIGASMVARAAPDGYTFLYASLNSQVYRQYLVKDVGYDPVKDFTPVAKAVETYLCIAAGATSPFNTLQDVIDYAKRFPGKLSYSTTGIGTGHHLNSEHLKALTGIDFVHVPYKTGPQQMTDMISGLAPVGGTILANAIPPSRSGKVKVLAIIGDKRSPIAPNVPMVKEIVPGFASLSGWSAYFGPAGLPRPIVSRMHAEIVKAAANPATRAKLEDVGYGIDTSTPEELDAILKRDIALAAKMSARAGVKPE